VLVLAIAGTAFGKRVAIAIVVGAAMVCATLVALNARATTHAARNGFATCAKRLHV
jgi:hypothetical protein